jgi:hypothetical protein
VAPFILSMHSRAREAPAFGFVARLQYRSQSWWRHADGAVVVYAETPFRFAVTLGTLLFSPSIEAIAPARREVTTLGGASFGRLTRMAPASAFASCRHVVPHALDGNGPIPASRTAKSAFASCGGPTICPITGSIVWPQRNQRVHLHWPTLHD